MGGTGHEKLGGEAQVRRLCIVEETFHGMLNHSYIA